MSGPGASGAVGNTTFSGSLSDGVDAEHLSHLAALSGGSPPEGVVLFAEVAGDPVAAIGLFDRRSVSDPRRAGLALRTRLRLLRLHLRLVVAVRGM